MPTPDESDAIPTQEYVPTSSPVGPAMSVATSPEISPPVFEAALASPPLLSGRYELLEEIARGGMGAVIRCRDHHLHRDVVIKVMHDRLQDRPDSARRFLEEARITGQLQHPGIVPIHEQGTLPDGRPFFAMKLVRGETLAHLLKARPDPTHDRQRFLVIFAQICQAVAFAHSRGVIHRDLKPLNVMVGAFGEVQVMDWGLAKVVSAPSVEAAGEVEVAHPEGAGGTQAGAVMGTLAYMPPEQARGEVDRVDRRSDVFGLGAILCEILTGERVYTGNTPVALRAQAGGGRLEEAYARLEVCGADADLIGLATRCLAAEQDERPQDADAVARAVATYLAAVDERARQAEQERAAAEARVEEAKATAAAERRARRLTLGLAVSALLILAAGGTVAWVVWQQYAAALARQHEAGEKARTAMETIREKVRQGWEANDVVHLAEARQDADRAVDIAAGASDDIRAEAVELRREVETKLGQAKKNVALTAAVLDVTEPREVRGYQRQEDGHLEILVQPSVNEQFVAAFRRWGVDLDGDAPREVLAKFQDVPDSVRLEMVAGLDAWALERRSQGRPEEEWRRPHELADRLDRDAARREVRQLRASGALQHERLYRELTWALSGWGRLVDPPEGPCLRRLRELADRLDPIKEPVLSVVTLARALDLAGAPTPAERVLRSTLAARPREVGLTDALAKHLEWQGPARLPEAIEWYRAGRSLRPELGIGLSLGLRKARRLAEAEEVLRDLVRQRPGHPELRFYLADTLYDQQKLGEAIRAYQDGLDLKPDHKAFNNLGSAFYDQGKLDQAEAAFRGAILLLSDFPEAYHNLGLALRDQNRLTLAVAAFEKAILLKQNFPEAYNSLGLTLWGQEKPIDAEAAFRKAIALKSDYPEAYYALGLVLHQQQPGQAEAAFRKAVALRFEFPEAHNHLGVVLEAQKRRDEAVTAYRQAIALKSDYAEAYNNLGLALRAQKKLNEALVALRKARQLLPDHPTILRNLRLTEHWAGLDERLPAIVAGRERPANLQEQLEFARFLAIYKREYRAACDFYAAAFAADPNVAGDPRLPHRYNAARSAALAAAGKGDDAADLDDKERDGLRQRALDWLRADLGLWDKVASDPQAHATIRQVLTSWLHDFAAVRDAAALAKLPEDERAAWWKLWDDVAAVLKKAEMK